MQSKSKTSELKYHEYALLKSKVLHFMKRLTLSDQTVIAEIRTLEEKLSKTRAVKAG